MSIIRSVIRMSVVGALRSARTWAGDLVLDSDNTPLIDLIKDQGTQVFITVYTDLDTHTDLQGHDYYLSTRSLRIIIEIGLAAAVAIPADEGGGFKLQIPDTDAGLEVAVDIAESQVMAALFGDPSSPWADLLKRLILRIDRIPSQRGGASEKSRRWAARQLVIIADPISDLPPGVPYGANHPVKDFVTLANQTGGAMAEAANLIDKAISDQTTLPDWQQAQAWLGLTNKGIVAIGLAKGPLIGAEDSAVTIDDDTNISDGTPQVFMPTEDGPGGTP